MEKTKLGSLHYIGGDSCLCGWSFVLNVIGKVGVWAESILLLAFREYSFLGVWSLAKSWLVGLTCLKVQVKRWSNVTVKLLWTCNYNVLSSNLVWLTPSCLKLWLIIINILKICISFSMLVLTVPYRSLHMYNVQMWTNSFHTINSHNFPPCDCREPHHDKNLNHIIFHCLLTEHQLANMHKM